MPLLGMYFDPMYFAILGPGMLLALWATFKVKTTFARYRRERVASGMTGAETAREILRRNNLHDVKVVETSGMLSDHYDPRTRTVRLSPDVYRLPSVASVAVAAHEVGHALQHARGYAPLALRSAAVPLANLGSFLPWILIAVGMWLQAMTWVYAGIILFAGVVFFQFVTLPVEFNASKRARAQLADFCLVSERDAVGVKKVLFAAALTYVAGAITAVLTLLYFLLRAGLLGGRRN
ncbi:MAG TPA: zinc metallopeptidase [Polyangia bacterium]|nr:zinc metallopeptidase [Polyangia bacterium]